MSDYIKWLRSYIGNKPLLQCGAGVIVENNKGEILLLKRSDNLCWGYAGGAIEPGERVEDAAKRELFEETGLVANNFKLFGVYSGDDNHYIYPNGDEVHNIDIVYICNSFSGELTPDNTESLEIRFFDINNLPDKISPPLMVPLNDYIKSQSTNKKAMV